MENFIVKFLLWKLIIEENNQRYSIQKDYFYYLTSITEKWRKVSKLNSKIIHYKHNEAQKEVTEEINYLFSLSDSCIVHDLYMICFIYIVVKVQMKLFN